MSMQRFALLGSTMLALIGTPATAAGAPPASAPEVSAIQDIVVTAERRVSSTQKTALNITALGAEQLASSGVRDSRTMLDSVPGLKLSVANPNAYIGLYGLASGAGTQYADTIMAFNYGGVPLARQISANSAYYDLERVEILKGPQGTLYGRNATVGAINLIPARPKDELAGGGSITLGNYNTLNTSGYINTPITENLAGRVAFQTTRHDGYFTNGLDDANNYGLRGSLLWKPSEKLSVLLFADAYFNRSRGPYSTWRYYMNGSQEWIDPSNPWFGLGAAGTCSNQLLCPSFASTSVGGVNAVSNPQGFTNTGPTGYGSTSVYGQDGRNNADQLILSTEITYAMPWATLTVQPSYVHTKIDFMTYSNGLKFWNLTYADQLSLEARLSSTGNGPLRWTLGAFLFNEDQDATLNNLQSTGYAILRTPKLNNHNVAVFGDTTYALTPNLRFNAGIRYTRDGKSQNGYTVASGLSSSDVTTIAAAGGTCTSGGTPSAPTLFDGQFYFPTNFCVVPNGGQYRDGNTSWKVGVEFDPRPGSLLYATARTGFRAGGFTVGTQNNYKPEHLTAYEIGSKNRFMGGKLQLNASAFYWKYKDQQVSQLQLYYLNGIAIGQTSYPSNFNGNLYGAEVDLQAFVTPNDRIGIDALWTKGKYDSTPPVATLNTSALVSQYNLGRNNLPEWTIVGNYEHTFHLANGSRLVAGGRVHYESSAVLRIIDPALLTPGDIRNAYAKLDMDLTWHDAKDRFTVQLYVQNLTDKAVVGVGSGGQTALGTFFRPSSNVAGARSATLDPPRTFGLRLTGKF
ncbi:iron complex outermembrane receptor protein [Novosphingobium sp. SG751A]|uniref:TonB-dependent receptor n=1 Tax=Novosphingobium sp. SG751A TaxID=2587000 RepID=UPI001556028F|nr:TonB-dependent receptor [Novosphingobium sp. SG751A]NOW44716.1 iron complex outermembrane receptor protein [Novosphingobium sp. SG751A]